VNFVEQLLLRYFFQILQIWFQSRNYIQFCLIEFYSSFNLLSFWNSLCSMFYMHPIPIFTLGILHALVLVSYTLIHNFVICAFAFPLFILNLMWQQVMEG
jgi:hypothetical protein